MTFFNYIDSMTSWYGLYEGIPVLDSIKNYGFAIRQIEVGKGIFECYLPYPEDDEYCIHITDISRERIITILEESDELDSFLELKHLSISDLEGGMTIVAILKYLDDIYDIMDFFELQYEEKTVLRKIEAGNKILKSFLKVKRSQYSFFDNLLNNHGLNSCPEYLWKIKVTNDEYKELKEFIVKRIQENAASDLYEREVALLFAEFHRREYTFRDADNDSGQGPTESVLQSLNIQGEHQISIREFGRIAKKGADRLGIQLYENDRAVQYVYSLLYHGGLPLRKLAQQSSHNTWHRLVRHLLESDEPVDFNNFEDLVTSVTANNIDALKAFCQELQNAILTKDYLALPFYCSSETDPNYQMFLNLGQRAEAEIKSRNPFRLAWIFEINMNRKVIRPKFSISGPDSISFDSEFIVNNDIADVDCFSISSYEDGNELSNVTYRRSQNDFYGDRALRIESYYNADTNISVRCPELLENEMLLSEELDNLSPQIVSENEDGDYVITNNRYIGHKEVMVIVPDGWTINDEQNYYVDEGYDYLGSNAKIVILRQGVENQSVVLTDVDGGRKTISATVPLTKVVVGNIGKVDQLGQSAFFNAKNLVFYLKRLDGRMRRINSEDLLFCSDRRTGTWLTNPPYGYIYVKSSDENNNADPIKILNLGNAPRELRINYMHSDANSCSMSVEWDNGTVECPMGQFRDNIWLINKNELEDSRFVKFIFKPTTLGNPFTLLVKTRFSDFQIYDEEGRPIQRYSYISLADLPRYNYHIQNIDFNLNVRISEEGVAEDDDNNHRNENYIYKISAANNYNERLVVTIRDKNNNTDFEKTISRESSLDQLFGGVERLNALINRHPGDIRHTEIKVSANVNRRSINFQIKKYPFVFEKNVDNLIEIKTHDGQRAAYKGMVKAMPLYGYDGVVPVELDQDEDGYYLLPNEVREWGDVLLYSGKEEWVLPHFIDCTINGENPAARKERMRNIFFPMRNTEYPNAAVWSETWQRGCFWFEKAYKEHIPAMSLFDLNAIMSSSKLMARFVFNMLLWGLKGGDFADYKNWLKHALLDMADENSFLWIWVHKNDCTFNNLGFENTNWNDIRGFLQGWYLYKQDFEGLQRLFTNGEPKEEDTQFFMFGFIDEEYAGFISDLRHTSMDRFLSGNTRGFSSRELMARLSNPRFLVPDYVTDTLDTLYFNPEEERSFEDFLNNEIRRRPVNFRLFYERAKLFFDTIKRDSDVDLFSYKLSIRKSVLYYTSYFKDEFIQLCTYNGN